MISREQKAEIIADLSGRFGRAKASFLVDFKGLNVEEVTRLRKTLQPLEAEFKVVRNSLAKRALTDHPKDSEAFEGQFVGTNAVVFAYGDVGASAKAITEFSKEVEELVVKSGVMDGTALDEAKVTYLGKLPGKDELRAKLLGTFQAPMAQFVRTLDAVPSGFARLLGAYKDSKSEG